jgi:DNA ligase-1
MSIRTSLYQEDARGKMRVWSITSDDNTIVMQHGELGGALQIKTEVVRTGLATRTIEEQVRSRVRSRINKQYDRGYKDSVEEARAMKGTNSLSLFKPMLAKPLKDVRNIDYYRAYTQYKYDGHRCLITKQDGKLMAYSRQGKLITSIDHILDGINLQEGMTLDGELYCHGVPLQTIGSWIKREQDATKSLIYCAYDSVAELPFAERLQQVGVALARAENASVAPTAAAGDDLDVRMFFSQARAKGYEGAILRWGEEGYQVGKRSKYLVKVKTVMDNEFRVIDMERSKDGWAILVCEAKNYTPFKVNAPGGYEEKFNIWKNRDSYIGRMVTVEYANLTTDGIPFHPVATTFREDV